MRNLFTTVLTGACIALMSSNASALLINATDTFDANNNNVNFESASDVTLTSANLVGVYDVVETSSAEASVVAGFAQAILNLGLDDIGSLATGTVASNDVEDYSGTVIDYMKVDTNDGTSINSGWEYVMGKYNGKNAGYVLWYLGGADLDIPTYDVPLWGTKSGQYQLSNITYINSTTVPEPSILALIGGGLVGLGFARRRKKQA